MNKLIRISMKMSSGKQHQTEEFGRSEKAVNPFSKGDIFVFGEYRQYYAIEKPSPIEWIVSEVYPNSIMLLSKYALIYDEDIYEGLWLSSHLRTLLNDRFYKMAFNIKEKKLIDMRSICSTSIGNSSTQPKNEDPDSDKVFVLSMDEYKKLPSHHIYETDFCEKSHVYDRKYGKSSKENAPCLWIIDNDGHLKAYQEPESKDTYYKRDCVVRPAIIVSLTSIGK